MWLLQKNIWKEEKYNQLQELLDRYKIEYKVLNVIPFSDELEEEIDFSKVEMVFGSIKMTDICRKRGCDVFYGDSFDYSIWGPIFGEVCLNQPSDVFQTSMKKIEFPLTKDVFIRPILDDKSFSGQILRIGDTREQIQFATSKEIDDIEVIICPIKKILSEYRCAVVNEKIITASMYKLGRRVQYQKIGGDHPAYLFAETLVHRWIPAEMCIIDVADTPDGWKLVEFGCIHNCGFYDLDLSKLIQEIQEYYTTKEN